MQKVIIFYTENEHLHVLYAPTKNRTNWMRASYWFLFLKKKIGHYFWRRVYIIPEQWLSNGILKRSIGIFDPRNIMSDTDVVIISQLLVEIWPKIWMTEQIWSSLSKYYFFCLAPFLKIVPTWWSNIVGSFIRVLNFARFSVFVHISLGLIRRGSYFNKITNWSKTTRKK